MTQTTRGTTPTLDATRARLAAVGQTHLLNFFPTLTPDGQRALLAQIADLDVEALPALIDAYVKRKPEFSLPPNIGPAPYYPRHEKSTTRPWDRAAAERKGEELIRAHVPVLTKFRKSLKTTK